MPRIELKAENNSSLIYSQTKSQDALWLINSQRISVWDLLSSLVTAMIVPTNLVLDVCFFLSVWEAAGKCPSVNKLFYCLMYEKTQKVSSFLLGGDELLMVIIVPVDWLICLWYSPFLHSVIFCLFCYSMLLAAMTMPRHFYL